MSEVPFVNALGEAIEAAAEAQIHAERAAARRPRRRRRLQLPRGRARLIVVLAVLAVGGAAAAETLQSSTALVAGAIACYESTGTDSSAYYNVPPNGRTPQAACAHTFLTSGPAALAAPGVRLVACTSPHGYVAVFQASGSSDQCHALGMSPTQAAPYAAGAARVDRLLAELKSLSNRRACVTPHEFVDEVQGILARLGWTGWRAAIQTRLSAGGPCGSFEATGSSASDPAASLDGQTHTVWVVAGPAR